MKKSDLTDILLTDLCGRVEGPLTQQQIADATGLSRQHISRIELTAIKKLREAVDQTDVRYEELHDILSHLDTGDGK